MNNSFAEIPEINQTELERSAMVEEKEKEVDPFETAYREEDLDEHDHQPINLVLDSKTAVFVGGKHDHVEKIVEVEEEQRQVETAEDLPLDEVHQEFTNSQLAHELD